MRLANNKQLQLSETRWRLLSVSPALERAGGPGDRASSATAADEAAWHLLAEAGQALVEMSQSRPQTVVQGAAEVVRLGRLADG